MKCLVMCMVAIATMTLHSAENQIFPKDFLWGVATNEYQNSGAALCPESNWAAWEKTKGHIVNGDQSGESTRHYLAIPQTIEQLKQLGVNAYRFSIEWSKIEPKEGQFDEVAIEHYSQLINQLLKAGMTPMVTLHHFSHPIWFEALGGFTREENNRFFLRFAQKMFNRFSDRVKLWCTINKPGVYAMQGYVFGQYPPGKVRDLTSGAHVIKNMLAAHQTLYTAWKKHPNGRNVQIGLAHQFVKFVSNQSWYGMTNMLASHFTYLFHQAIFDALKTGTFTLNYGLLGGIAPHALMPASRMMDFIGVDYYTELLFSMQMLRERFSTSTANDQKDIEKLDQAVSLKGLYHALIECKDLNIPVYITEFGISEHKDQISPEWIKAQLKNMQLAIQNGVQLKGAFYWTLNDSFEWDFGFEKKFGLYNYDLKGHTFKLKKGAEAYVNAVKLYRPQVEAKAAPKVTPKIAPKKKVEPKPVVQKKAAPKKNRKRRR
ncbi:MAG: family 1 glycosylhydrolase [Simkaniaceae bacterium]|nr:family 1 glycosylhydrolase [Simkaniaceae bacterium]